MRSRDENISDAEWDGFVRAHPDGTFFHLSGWKRVVGETFGHRAHYFSVRENGTIAGILPLIEVRSALFGHALISNAFCVGGGPLCTSANALPMLLDQAEERARALGVSYIELRDTPTPLPGWVGRSDLYAGFARPIMRDAAEDLKQIPRKQRAVLRKALDADFTVTIDDTADLFFRLYARTMRNYGTPALSLRFFTNVLTTFGTQCEVLTVHQQGRPMSSVLSYFFGDRVLPYYTGSAAEARANGANDFMYWSLMRRAQKRGCRTFDFGRSKIGTGPYHFKQNWGFPPRPVTHQYRLFDRSELPEINPNNPRYAFFIQAWRHLPVPVANAIAPFLSRGLG
jgi:FemAB-related protein (PEP-CTERM system-associated)